MTPEVVDEKKTLPDRKEYASGSPYRPSGE